MFFCNLCCFLMKKLIKLQYKIKCYESNINKNLDIKFMYMVITTID
jgi:hypothetical protein